METSAVSRNDILPKEIMVTTEEIEKTIRLNGKYWIVFTGDSITSCEWVHPNWRDVVIYVLQNEMTKYLKGDWKTAEWEIRGFNFAYDGATTKDILDRIDDVLLTKPQLVISLMGGNDPALGISLEETAKNINTIVDKVIRGGSHIVWSNSTPSGESAKNEDYAPYADAVMHLPDRGGLQKIDMFRLYKQYPVEKFFTFKSEENPVEGIKAGEPDLHHPNQLGNAYIAKVILKEVFGIGFDPDRYIAETLKGEKYPSY